MPIYLCFYLCNNYDLYELSISLSITSCAPPSEILTSETIVNLATLCSSGIVVAPQLHIVDFIFATVISKFSFKEPA